MTLAGRIKAAVRPAAYRHPRVLKYRHPYRVLTSPARVLPDWAIIGAAKSGTTTLYDLLVCHPCVVPAMEKEVRYFSHGLNYGHGESWYRSHFATRMHMRRVMREAGSALTGEASPDYLFMPASPARMRRLLPDARLLVILRNPVDAAYSYYSMNVRMGREALPFGEAMHADAGAISGARARLEADPEDDRFVFRGPSPHPFSVRTYIGRYEYAGQLRRWFAHYPRDRFLILTNEELRADRQGTLDRAFAFLGLEPFGLPPAGDSNVGTYRPMDPQVRGMLVEHFRPHNAELEGLLGRGLGWDR